MSRQRVADGWAGEDKVVVDHDTENNLWWVWLNGVNTGVLRVDIVRDGGTKLLHISGGRCIRFPRQMSEDDRIPKLDGVDII